MTTKSEDPEVEAKRGSQVARRRSGNLKKAATDVKPRKQTAETTSSTISSKKKTRSSTAAASSGGISSNNNTKSQRSSKPKKATSTDRPAVEHVKRKRATKKSQSMREGIVRTLSNSSAAKAAAKLLLNPDDLEEMDEPLILNEEEVNHDSSNDDKPKSKTSKDKNGQTKKKKKKTKPDPPANNCSTLSGMAMDDEEERLNSAILASREEERQVQQAIQQSLEEDRRLHFERRGSLEDFDLELQKGSATSGAKNNRVRQMMIDASRQSSDTLGLNDSTEISRYDDDLSPSHARRGSVGSDIRVTRVSPKTGRRHELHQSKARSTSERSLAQSKPPVYCCCLSKAWFCCMMLVINAVIVSITVSVFSSVFGGAATQNQPDAQGPAAMRGDDMDVIIPYDQYPTGGGSTGTTTSTASSGNYNSNPAEPAQPIASADLPPLLHTFDEDQHASTLALLSQSVMAKPYENAEALHFDLTVAAKRLVETNVQRQLLFPAVWLRRALARPVEDEEPISFVDTPLQSFDSESSVPQPAFVPPQYPNGDVAEQEAILNVLGIKPGDPQAQMDPASGRVFVANGDTLSVHGSSTPDSTTILPLATVTLPPISSATDASGPPPRETWLLRQARELESHQQQQQAWTPAQPKATIEQVLLTPDGQYVVCVVSGYGSSLERLQRGSTSSSPLIEDYLRTQLITYQVIVNLGIVELQQVGQWHNVHGTIIAAYASNGQVQLVTTTAVDTDRFLANPHDRSFYPDYSDEDYVADVRETANGKYVPEFTRRLKQELGDASSLDLNLWRLNRWQTQDVQQLLNNNGDDRLGPQLQAMEDLVLSQSSGDGGVLHHLVLVTTLHIQTASVSTSAFFTPSSSVQVIPAPSGRLLLFTSGWGWKTDPESPTMEPVTHVLSLALSSDGLAATHLRSIGTLRGHVLGVENKRSLLDAVTVVHGEVRIATSVRKQWRLEPTQWTPRGKVVQEEWVLEKYMSVLNLDTLAQQRPQLRIGSASEQRITAVRYFSDDTNASTNGVAYVIPRDPSRDVTSVLKFDTASATAPIQILGQITVAGFSQYAHALPPIEGNGNLVVSVGQHTNIQDGVFTGWMISLWDLSNPAQPQVVTQYHLDGDTGENAGKSIHSLTRWNASTFRVAPSGQLILPLSTEYMRNPNMPSDTSPVPDLFEGFVVYNLSPQGIAEHARIPHSAPSSSAKLNILCPGDNDCPVDLLPRSLVGGSSGVMVTMDGTTVTSTNIASGLQQWQFEVN